MNWENRNLVNIVTRHNSAPGQQVTVNYNTDEGRILDGTWARGENSGPQEYIENIPDSELMDGDEGDFLITDTEVIKRSKKAGRIEEEGWENIQIEMQSVIPGAYGPDVNDGPVRNRNIIFDGDAMTYIGEHYDDSAEAVNEVTVESMEIAMATAPLRDSGRYVGVTAGGEGLEVDAIYSHDEGKEKMSEPVAF
ncbi:hypothetical protein [Salarchaeum sp. JOR-1]|uniref:hypothetical protein n=1 Tax=Salarchaeum sp. JOR-1 TaxID=2599399 RepID=UPI0011985282|nr:hypothetical protein [Salarchaeum sp. JOR-1]QDX41229.1 hypothetical protein FQU85_10105 [Salarchaeum sp. JOR-1]